MRECRLYVKCYCGRDDVQIAESEGECEKKLEQRGWRVFPSQMCPECRKQNGSAK